MDKAATTLSSEEESQSSAESETFHSAQWPQKLDYGEQAELVSQNEEPSDISSAKQDAALNLSTIQGQNFSADIEASIQRSVVYEQDPVVSYNGFSASPPPPTRPNKYRGPISTWRKWTASERDLASSLDQLRARDLSVHLYNAFKLKRRALHVLAHQRSSDQEETKGEAAWGPPKVWTAWPLSPDIVPREEDEKHWEEDKPFSDPRYSKLSKPSDTLRELLVAQVLREANARFAARELEDGNEETIDVQPVITADDERAAEILRPTIQHILRRLDSLLMGLHYERNAYLPIYEDAESEMKGLMSGGSMSKSRGRKRKRDASTSDTHSSPSPRQHPTCNSDDTPRSRGTSKSRNVVKRLGSYSRNSSRTFHKRKIRLGLRGWSEVLGVASMTGWDSTVIERAAARCSALFGEGILFRTLHEAGSEAFTEIEFLPGAASIVTTNEITRIEKKKENIFDGVHLDGFLTPIEGKKSWKYSSEPNERIRTPRE